MAQFVVAGPVGQEVGRFLLPADVTAQELQALIHEKVGPPPGAQRLLVGERLVEPQEVLLQGSAETVDVTLLLKVPEASPVDINWKALPETCSFLEDLHINKDWTTPVVPASGVESVGMDPNTGLLLVLHAGDDRGVWRSSVAPAHLHAENDLEALQKGGGDGGYGGNSGKGGNSKGKSKGKAGAPRGSYKWIWPESFLLVLPGEIAAPPFEVSLPAEHPLNFAVELRAVEAMQSFPVPSYGLAVAMVTVDCWDLVSSMRLVCCELCGAMITWKKLSEASSSCEAFCLNASSMQAISVHQNAGKRHVIFHKLRGFRSAADSKLEDFVLQKEKPVSSIAYTEESKSVLLTFAGEHAIYVYQKDSTWQHISTLGDPKQRGCSDGPAKSLRFWFPVSSDSKNLMDSKPLVPGPTGKIYIHTGGALMMLTSDLSEAKTISSMREELWMVENDEGTPEYPMSFHVFGVGRDGKVYRSLLRTDYREETLIRRLQISDNLRQARSKIRDVAPAIWPKLDENRHGEHWVRNRSAESKLIYPHYYAEHDRDRWDGKRTWLFDPWLWQAVDKSLHPPKLRCFYRRAITFTNYIAMLKYDEEDCCVKEEFEAASDELEERRTELPAEVKVDGCPYVLVSKETSTGYTCNICGNCEGGESFFDFAAWGYVCEMEGVNFTCHPFCALPEEYQKRKALEARWLEIGQNAFAELPLVFDPQILDFNQK